MLDATTINVGAIIGAGIFVVTGIAAGLAGSSLVISMVIAAIVASLTALSFAEVSSWLPIEGGVYEFAYQLLSPLAGFLSGWMWMLFTSSQALQFLLDSLTIYQRYYLV